jgi:hypothetical protein
MEEEEDAVQAFWEGASNAPTTSKNLEPRSIAQNAGQAFQKAMESGKSRVSSMSPTARVLAGTALLGVAAGLFLGAHLRKR